MQEKCHGDVCEGLDARVGHGFLYGRFFFHFCGCMAALWTLNKHLVGTTALNKETGVKSSSQTVHLWPPLEPSV